MQAVISATEARRRFFEIIDWAAETGRDVVVEKDGKRAVVISGTKMTKSKDEIVSILENFKKTMGSYPRRSPLFKSKEWAKKEATYLRRISSGGLRGE